MRDPKRISRILFLIGRIWVKNPDLRLCQLIGNVVPHFRDSRDDNYQMEDDDLEKRLKLTYLSEENESKQN